MGGGNGKPKSLGAVLEEHELRPDGWQRFERAVDAAVKSGPQHRITSKTKERPASKGRVHKGKTRV